MVKHLRVATFAAIAALMSILSVPSRAHAAGCGTYPRAAEMLPQFAGFFTADGYAVWRGTQVDQISPTEPQYIVTDSATCEQVYAQAISHLSAEPRTDINLTAGAHQFAVFRYGPYYAMFIVNLGPDDPFHRSPSRFLVFRASDLTFVRGMT